MKKYNLTVLFSKMKNNSNHYFKNSRLINSQKINKPNSNLFKEVYRKNKNISRITIKDSHQLKYNLLIECYLIECYLKLKIHQWKARVLSKNLESRLKL